jgi:hypothetical protein
MSKKSRKRNKKILAALALAGGAAMLAKGRGKSVADTAASEDANINVTHPALTAKNYITKKADVVAPGSSFKPRVYPGTMLNERGPIVSNVTHPALGQSTARPNRFNRLKGGGIAKRGMGAAYKSGGRVKSMGIAKRGGGVAKR